MERRLADLSNKKFDVLVIGAGIYGACIAWDAAERGLSVALIDQGDFGHATSANSLKTVHGGLRYLQDLKFSRIRMMVSERTAWLRVAPHLVHPIPVLMPTSRKFLRSKTLMTIALRLNEWISFDRNQLEDPEKWILNGQILSKSETLEKLPGFDGGDITGGALWYDAQVSNTERLVLAIVLSASEAGAVVANYVEATNLKWNDLHVSGAIVKDILTSEEFEIRADLVINSAGAWAEKLLNSSRKIIQQPIYHPSAAVNIVIPQVLAHTALGFQGHVNVPGNNGHLERKPHLFFMAPWSGYSILGTIHFPVNSLSHDAIPYEPVIQNLIKELNRVFPNLALGREDVCHIHRGFLPIEQKISNNGSVKLVRESRIYDHQKMDGVGGLITILGPKYTSARKTAQLAIDLALRKLGKQPVACQTDRTPVFGGHISKLSSYRDTAVSTHRTALSREIIENIVSNYGSNHTRILEYVRKDRTAGERVSKIYPVIKAEIIHAVREEMALKLGDVIHRRTELGSVGLPDESCIHICAQIMAKELGWNDARIIQEITEARENHYWQTEIANSNYSV